MGFGEISDSDLNLILEVGDLDGDERISFDDW